MKKQEEKIKVATSVKDEQLIMTRRKQIVRAAIELFRIKGFHPTTTREIAKAAGFSIGTLYEYIRSKDDVLYLVCDSIFDEVTDKIAVFQQANQTIDQLKQAIGVYYRLIDEMLDEFTIMYQETKSLPKEAMQYILKKELEMVSFFEELIANSVDGLSKGEIFVAANAIVVQGQSWAFRKWALHKHFTIDQFIEYNTNLALQGLLHLKK